MDTDRVTGLLAEVAEQVILPRFRALSEGEIDFKRPGDPVTVADREAEVELAKAFLAENPHALIVGEEGAFADPSVLAKLPIVEHAWVIDPVDGTRNFAQGSPDFGVMVAEVRRGVTVRAWIWQPVHQQLWVAERGAGVRRNGASVTRIEPGGSVAPDVAADDRPGRAPTRRDERPLLGATYGRLIPPEDRSIRLIRTVGACAIDYPLLIQGQRDFLSYRSLNPWDHLPGALMLSELGGRAATTGDEDFVPGTTGRVLLAATSPGVWRRVRQALYF